MKNHNNDAEKLIRDLAKTWPAPFITRAGAVKATGGAVSKQTLANADCSPEQNGVEGMFILNGKACYPIENFIEWLVARLEKRQ